MKRKFMIIVILVLTVGLCFVLGFDNSGLTKPSKSANEETVIDGGTSTIESTTQILTENDKAVKAEIAKYSDTTVDFRHSKNVTIQGQNYDVVFEKFSSKTNPSKIVYANDKGDSFEYDIKTGKLCNITLESNIVEKTNDSIDIATAQKIALEYFPDDCNINEYTVTKLMEFKDGYVIWYTRYIGQYMTTDAFRMEIGFDGSIVHINDATDVFDGKSLDFNEDFVTAKVEEYVNEHKGVEISNTVILVDNGIACVDCVCKQTFDDGSTSAFHVSIPLE